MPDIAMCADDACPSRKSCYRSPANGTSANDRWQTFMEFRREPGAERCASYWPNPTNDAS